MKILVCVKQVPDKDSTLRVRSDGTWIETESLSFQINDYDRYALEAALQIKDASGGEVVVCTVGPDRASQAIKTALAMGADRAVHVNDPEAEGADALGLARILHAVAAGESARGSFDLVLLGLQSEDDNSGQVGPMLARLLDLPCATGVIKYQLSEDGRSMRVERELENNRCQVVDLDLPALVTVQTGFNQPRYASLKGIMAAKRKELRAVGLADLGLSSEQAGSTAAKMMKVVSLAPPPKGKGARMIEGNPSETAAELVQRIKEKAGVL